MPRRSLRVRSRSSSGNILLVAIGAAAGVALGALLADRLGAAGRWPRRTRTAEALPEGDVPMAADGVAELDDDDDLADDGWDGDERAWDPELAHTLDPRNGADLRPHRVVPPDPDPAELEARVLEAFRNDPVLRDRAIDIGGIATGVIELTGWVHDADEVQHATTLAGGVPDVHTVLNQLAVRAPVEPDA